MMAFENSSKRTAQDLVVSAMESKKRKVEFSDKITMYTEGSHNDDDNNNENISTEMYKRFVKSALDELEKNSNTQVGLIASQIALLRKSEDHVSLANLDVLLDVLSDNISRIETSRASPLIQSIVHLEKWWELPSQTLGKYIFFIRVLCSSIPKWWQDVSMVLISGFHLPVEMTINHHDMLRYFLKMIPSSMGFIDIYMPKFFPSNNDSCKNLVNYVANLLKFTSYCKELQFQAWSLIIERVISLDVELQNELDELDDDIEDEDLDLDDDEDAEDDDDDDEVDVEDDKKDDIDEDGGIDGQEEYNVQATRNIKDFSKKLDAILTMVTECLSEKVTPESLKSGEGVSVFNTITTLFKTHILPTYFTRSVQYIMFHISQHQIELMDSFLVTLIDISFSPTETAETRIKSLQYLGSFIARAKKLSRTQIIFVASYLASWLNRYVLEREEEVDQPGGMDRFKHFYGAFQALCYIFCFRHALFRDADGNWECELDKFFQRMVISKFNPLKYCNENVMLMFARISQHEDLAYCFSIIENNNNQRLRGIIGRGDKDQKGSMYSSAATTWSLATRQQFIDLQSYFPYDPLILERSKEIMKEFYIEWSEVSGEYESDGLED
ncbi:hypothetical protein HG537_0A03730 [Torulaspora globosa]|uniref:RNA polymerase I-specific transcription initiation factor RRN3 n=1 Tax=Torulaspora globosa TaxID=48254 RepID=A0A7H9HLA3_9SACH|nr:hypothetical protein HG537_0A03730 [Torulaspora sp. CBS 2947]